jgi:hypothetical protein
MRSRKADTGQVTGQDTGQVTGQDTGQVTGQVTPDIEKLLSVMTGELKRAEIGLKVRFAARARRIALARRDSSPPARRNALSG